MGQHRVVLVEVRRDEVAFIGDRSCLVSQLQRSDQDLTLSDTERTDRDRFPTGFTVEFIKQLGARDTAAGLLAQVRVGELLTQTEGHDGIPP